MAGIIEELELEKNKAPKICSFMETITVLSDEDRLELLQALDGSYQTTAIHKVLKNRQINVSYSVISRHRRGECLCESV